MHRSNHGRHNFIGRSSRQTWWRVIKDKTNQLTLKLAKARVYRGFTPEPRVLSRGFFQFLSIQPTDSPSQSKKPLNAIRFSSIVSVQINRPIQQRTSINLNRKSIQELPWEVKENENYVAAENARRKWACFASELKQRPHPKKRFSLQKSAG